jgi:exodeoxyribonuclease VII small subunit
MSDNPGYKEAYEELQQIVKDVENESIPLDELSEKVRRATMLIKICKNRLQLTEEDVNKILEEMDKKEG